MPAVFKVFCETPDMSEMFQKAGHTVGISWGVKGGMIHEVWNAQQPYLIIVQNPENKRLFITWAPRRDWHACPAPEIHPSAFAVNPFNALASTLHQYIHEPDPVCLVGDQPHHVLLLKAVVKECPQSEIAKRFGLTDGNATAELKINGVKVPLAKVLDNVWNDLLKTHTTDVKEAARQLTEGRFNAEADHIYEVIRGIGTALNEKLNRILDEQEKPKLE